MSKKFENTLMQFGENLGIKGLCFDKDNTCILLIDEITFSLQWKKDLNRLLIYCPLQSIEDDCPKELLLSLLEANCLGGGTHGLQLGLEKDLRVFILSGSTDTENISLVELERFIQFFVDEARSWDERLKEELTPKKVPDEATVEAAMLRI